MSFHSVRCCTMRPAMTGGGKQKPQAGAINTPCTNTSVPAEPAPAYWKKNGSASPFNRDS